MNSLLETTTRVLRRPLIITGAMLVVSVMIVVGAGWLREQSQASLEQARHAASDAQQQLRNVKAENQELERSLSLFQDLQRRGVLGQPVRLDWTEQIIAAAEPMLDFEYRFAPTVVQPAPPQPDGTPAHYQLLVTSSELGTNLRHEIELVDMLRRLERSGHLARTASCTLEQHITPESRGLIEADCVIDWINITPASAPGTAPGTAPGAEAGGASGVTR